MPRVREITEPGDDPLLKEAFAKEQAAVGAVFNTTKVQAHTPGIMKAAKALAAAVDRSGLLPKDLLPLLYLRVALVNGCPF
jgi:alkylhydroperoxidase family enzyme